MLFKVLLQLLPIKTSLLLKVNVLPCEGEVLFLFVFGSSSIKARHLQRSHALTITHLPTAYPRELYSKATIAGWEFKLCFKRQLLEVWLPTCSDWHASKSECLAAAQKQSDASSFHFPLKLPFQREKVLPWRADPRFPVLTVPRRQASGVSCRGRISEVLVTQSCLTLRNPTDCNPPGSSVRGILQERTLEWIAIHFSRGSSWPRDRTWVSCIASRFFTTWATHQGSPKKNRKAR